MKKSIILLAFVFAFACKKKNDEASSVSVTPVWYGFRNTPDDIINVDNGALFISSAYSNPSQGTSITSQKKLKGDFELKIKFSSFSASGSSIATSGRISFSLGETGKVSTPLKCILANNIMYTNESVNTQFKSTSAKEGEWYVKRVGSDFYTWFRAGSDTLFMNQLAYSTSDVSIGMLVWSLDNTSTATSTSVHVDDVLIVGGGGELNSDSFDHNTVTVVQ